MNDPIPIIEKIAPANAVGAYINSGGYVIFYDASGELILPPDFDINHDYWLVWPFKEWHGKDISLLEGKEHNS
jgi:hypothetical protein